MGEDSQDFGRGFTRICDNLGEYLQGFMRTLGEDSQGFANFEIALTRIHRDFGRGFTRICKTLGKDCNDTLDFGG